VAVPAAPEVGDVAGSLATAVDAALLLEAKCAPDGTKLGKTTLTERSVTAFDRTFSAPKSVSVPDALGDSNVVAAVEAAHTAAVVQAVGVTSDRVHPNRSRRCCGGRRKGGVRDSVSVSASHQPGVGSAVA